MYNGLLRGNIRQEVEEYKITVGHFTQANGRTLSPSGLQNLKKKCFKGF